MGKWAFLLGGVLVAMQPSFVRADSPRPGVTEANIFRIRAGMTRTQVERILGRPPTSWDTLITDDNVDELLDRMTERNRGGPPPSWKTNDPIPNVLRLLGGASSDPRAASVGRWSARIYTVIVSFDKAGRVLGKDVWVTRLTRKMLGRIDAEAAAEPRPGVTEANTRRIRVGMTLKEVEAILGGPGIDESRTSLGKNPFSSAVFWGGEEGAVKVMVHAAEDETDWTVTHVRWIPSRTNPSPLDQFRSWRGW